MQGKHQELAPENIRKWVLKASSNEEVEELRNMQGKHQALAPENIRKWVLKAS
jgi:hypothetical protein